MAKDMRTWIELLEEHGELIHIEREVDPEANMGALCHLAKEKALLFEKIKGHPKWRALAQAPANWRHMALAAGVREKELIFRLAELASSPPTPPLHLKGGPAPCQEVVLGEGDLDVRSLPAHVQSRDDGGRCISAGVCVVKDPDSGRYNLSIHRMMPMNRTETGFLMIPRHAWQVYQKYEAQNQPMPTAVVVGHHPLFFLAAAMTGPVGLNELELAGTFLGEPVRMVKAKSVDIEVPADAEMVLEGEIPPEVRRPEGPFGEFQGYYLTGETFSPVFRTKAITMRKDAIYKICQSAYDTEASLYHRIPMAVTLWNRLKATEGGVRIHNINVLPTNFTVVIQMTPNFEGQAKNVLLSALSGGYLHHKIAVAVDEDVDPFDPGDVWWAVSTRVNPVRDIIVIPGVRNHPMDPSITMVDPEKDFAGKVQSVGAKLLIDATKPSLSHPARGRFDRVAPMGWDLIDPKEWFPDKKPW